MQDQLILKTLFDYHIKNSKIKTTDSFLKFLYKSQNHFLIIILIASYYLPSKGIAYEKICNELNSQFASRTTILHILDDGVKLGFFIKKTDKQDHRKQNYSLNNVSRNIVYKWLENHPCGRLVLAWPVVLSK